MADINIGTEEINQELQEIAKQFDNIANKSKRFSKDLADLGMSVEPVVAKIRQLSEASNNMTFGDYKKQVDEIKKDFEELLYVSKEISKVNNAKSRGVESRVGGLNSFVSDYAMVREFAKGFESETGGNFEIDNEQRYKELVKETTSALEERIRILQQLQDIMGEGGYKGESYNESEMQAGENASRINQLQEEFKMVQDIKNLEDSRIASEMERAKLSESLKNTEIQRTQKATDEINRQIKQLESSEKLTQVEIRERKEILETWRKINDLQKRKNQTTDVKEQEIIQKTITQYEKQLEVLKAQNAERNEALRLLIKGEVEAESKLTEMEDEESEEKEKDSEGASKKIKSDIDTIENSASRLQQRLRTAFSVGILSNFFRGLVNITSEFERQVVALSTLVDSTVKGQELFSDVQGMALVSPYSVQELVTYTKQLAAYRVETNELTTTLKMLGDIASGVGVDMSRLILVYGQVKAANYLRGQELRQFSEAGVNILGELANYYSELEGVKVSVGEVFERVSDRKVLFQDVRNVLEDLTGSGGLFEDMQLRQSETIYGMMSNLKDAYQIAMNDMGSDLNIVLRGAIKTVRFFVDNIKTVVGAGLIFVSAKFGFYIQKMVKEASAFGNGIMGFFKAFKGGVSGGVVGLAVTAIVGVVTALISARKKTEEFNRQVNELIAESKDALDDFVDSIEDVAINGEINLNTEETFTFVRNEFEKLREELENKGLKIPIDIENIPKDETMNAEDAELYLRSMVDASSEAYLLGADMKQGKLNQYSDALKDLTSRLGNIKNIVNEVKSKGLLDKEDVDTMEDLAKAAKEFDLEGLKGFIDIIPEGSLEDSKSGFNALSKAIDKYLTKFSELKGAFISNVSTTYSAGVFGTTAPSTGTTVNTVFDDLFSLYNSDDTLKNEEEMERAVTAYINYIKGAFSKAEVSLDEDIWKRMVENFISIASKDKATTEKLTKFINEKFSFKPESELSNYQEFIEKEISNFQKNFNIGGNIVTISSEISDADIESSLKEYYEKLKNAVEKFEDKDVAKVALEKYIGKTLLPEDSDLETVKEASSQFEALLRKLGIFEDKKSGGGRGKDVWTERVNSAISFLKDLYQEAEKQSKTFNVDETTKRVKEAFQSGFEDMPEFFKNVFGSIDDINFMTPEGISEAFDKLDKAIQGLKISESTKQKLSRAVERAVNPIELDVEVAAKNIKKDKIIDDINRFFTQYDLSEELAKVNVPRELTAKMFGLEISNFNELFAEVTKKGTILLSDYGEEAAKEYEKIEKKLTDIAIKEQERRMKEYLKLLQDETSKRAAIELEYLRKRNEIMSLNTDDDTKDSLLGKVKETFDKQMSELEWETFKSSDLFVMLFEDLEYATVTAIDNMLAKLAELKDESILNNADADVIKEIVKAMNDLEDIKISRAPLTYFKELKNNLLDTLDGLTLRQFSKINDEILEMSQSTYDTLKVDYEKYETLYKKLLLRDDVYKQLNNTLKGTEFEGITVDSLPNAISEYEGMRDSAEEGSTDYVKYQNIIDLLYQYENIMKDIAGYEQADSETIKKKTEYLKGQLKIAEAALKSANKNAESVDTAYKALVKFTKNALEASRMLQETFNSIYDTIDALGIETNVLTDAWGDFFNTMFDLGNYIIELIPSIITGFTSAGVAINSAMGIIGLIAQAIQLTMQIIKALVGVHDARLELQIEKTQKNVDSLKKSYDKLSDAISTAYNADELRKYTKEMEANMLLQMEYLEDMIRLEQLKKKTDQEAIESYREEIEELYDSLNENTETYLDTVGGLSLEGQQTLAEDFANAWLSSFEEVGNGVQGLEDTFNEFVRNVVLKQLVQVGSKKYIDQLSEIINGIVSDGEVSAGEMVDLQNAWNDEIRDKLNAYYQSVYGLYENIIGGGELSGIEGGIQGVTEETAQVLSAYLNSIRFFVSAKYDQIIDIKNAIISTDNNSISSKLSIIANNTNALVTILEATTKTGHPEGGSGIKVFVN